VNQAMTTPLRVMTGRLSAPVTEQDHIRGPMSAPVTLLEYGDYQCPYCAGAHPIVQDLLQQRPDTVRFVFRNFPLTNAHPHAEIASETAEAAAARDRFWQMHDWLFEHQDEFNPEYVRVAAEQLGLPPDAIDREVNEHLYLDRIQRDFAGGIRSGVNGTPTFYLNEARHDGGYSLPELIAAVDGAAAPPDGGR
jgi:protein-disulfide isomerase